MAESGYAQPYQAGAGDSAGAGGSESEENNLIVNYIPSNLSEVDLRTLFSAHGTIVHCKLIIDRMTGTCGQCATIVCRRAVGWEQSSAAWVA